MAASAEGSGVEARQQSDLPRVPALAGRLPALLLPALAATGLVTALAALGFALGSLYGGLMPAGRSAAALPTSLAPAEDAVGGPEEALGLSLATTAMPPVLSASQAVAAAARTGVIERNLANGQDPARPVFWPVVGGWVSSGYGKRLDPFTGQQALHRGMDFAGLQNSTILAAGAGVVTWSGDRPGYGNLIEIDHGNGYVSRYGHNASNLVAVGDYVKAGQVIALMGATGRARGNHLHFEILRDGRHVNPARLVQRGG
jgi:murein DD-endopeptidase MepM/ murein hydrolase activator NlpD